MANGGYDDGYEVCDCFWGPNPAEMVQEACKMFPVKDGLRSVDLGCGEGKNSAELARSGFSVLALDKSHFAIAHAIAMHDSNAITWITTDLLTITGPVERFELAIATGSFHCLQTPDDISKAVALMQRLTKPGGINVLYSFNDGPQDMSGHSPEFQPTLLPHDWYVSQYQRGWKILKATNVLQPDVHPNNNIPHSHSITRILAKKDS